MADQPGHDPQHDDAAREPAGREAARSEDMRLLVITFAGSLAAILAGTIIVGLSLAFLRFFHKLPDDVQAILIGLMVAGIFTVGAIMRSIIRGYSAGEYSRPWAVAISLYFVLAAAGVLFFIGLAVGVK
jgi:O-antigen/teichoic acid export membrane protein